MGSMSASFASHPPSSVRSATFLWILAVATGIAESVAGVIDAAGNTSTGPLLLQIAFRTVVYGGLLVVIVQYFRRGVAWSRYLLAGLLGTVGIASLVIGPIGWLSDHGLGEIDWSAHFALIAGLRVVHIIAVVAALVLSFTPETRRWFHRRMSRSEVTV